MKRLWRTFLLLLVLAGLFLPGSVHAGSRVKIKYNGVKKSYARKSTTVYINGKKKSIKTTPIFMKSGTYMGPMVKLFRDSSLKVACKQSGKKMTMSYNGNTIVLKDGSRDVTTNGVLEKKNLGAIAMKTVVYPKSKVTRWVVPIKSVCLRLGITYRLSNGVVYLTGSNEEEEKSSATTEEKKPDASKVVLVLDAGHGGSDSGASGSLYKEKHLNLAILLGAKKYFDNDSRFSVYYTRTGDTYPSLADRANLANDKNADLFVSVHNNWIGDKSKTGTLTLYNVKQSKATKKNGITSKSLATAMQNAVLKTTGFKNRGVVKDTRGLYVLKNTRMPSCIIEYGFISNANQEKVIHANADRYGKELYEAIVAYMQTCGRIK